MLITLTVSPADADTILDGLSRLEWRVSNALILQIQQQARAQMTMPAETPTPESGAGGA